VAAPAVWAPLDPVVGGDPSSAPEGPPPAAIFAPAASAPVSASSVGSSRYGRRISITLEVLRML